jgi:glycosyltransferase involved in cell wall biosynthesis
VAAVVALHRLIGTWEKHVDAFVALTNFQKDVLSQAGLPADRVHVKPNFHPSPPGVAPWHERENKAMFVGRLGREKGVHVLLEAWRQWGRAAPRLEIAGDGPERASLEARARGAGLGDRVSFLGQVSHVEVEQRLRLSKLLIVPSLCYETFSLVVREAFAAGVAVAASRLESLSSILEDGRTGLLFKPGDAADLRDRIASAWAEIDLLSRMGTAARVTFERDCTAGRTYEMLRAIYQAAIRRRTLSA